MLLHVSAFGFQCIFNEFKAFIVFIVRYSNEILSLFERNKKKTTFSWKSRVQKNSLQAIGKLKDRKSYCPWALSPRLDCCHADKNACVHPVRTQSKCWNRTIERRQNYVAAPLNESKMLALHLWTQVGFQKFTARLCAIENPCFWYFIYYMTLN